MKKAIKTSCLVLGLGILLSVPSLGLAGGEEEALNILRMKQQQNFEIMAKRRAKYCQAVGGVWDKNRQICHVSLDLARTCALLGGKWVNGVCHFQGKCSNYED